MKEIRPQELDNNAFKMIGTDWLLVTAENNMKTNTMTASWGGVGIMWNKPVAFIFIRPQRYTKEFIDNSCTFSLSVLDEKYRDTLSYFGTVSGRDEDKIKKSGLEIAYDDKTPYFSDARTVFICKKLYAQQLESAGFIDETLDSANYSNKDYHTMYVAEIEKVLIK